MGSHTHATASAVAARFFPLVATVTLRVRNWDRYQYELKNATKRRRIAFDIEAALLDPHFQGQGGYARLGAWVRVIAWAGRLDNELPSETKWWRQEFGRHGDETRDRFIEFGWLNRSDSQSHDLGADFGSDPGADYESHPVAGDTESKPADSGGSDTESPAEPRVDSGYEVEVEKPLPELQDRSPKADDDEPTNVVPIRSGLEVNGRKISTQTMLESIRRAAGDQ